VQIMFEAFGQVTSVSTMFLSKKKGLAYCFVSYANPASAQAAITALNGSCIYGDIFAALEVRLKTEGLVSTFSGGGLGGRGGVRGSKGGKGNRVR
jgi:hypothetical protein